jgi:hypothetical protein
MGSRVMEKEPNNQRHEMIINLLKSCVNPLMMLSILGLATGYAMAAVTTEQSVKIKEAMTV